MASTQEVPLSFKPDDFLRGLHQLMLSDLDEQESRALARETEGKRMMEEAQVEVGEIRARRAILMESQRLELEAVAILKRKGVREEELAVSDLDISLPAESTAETKFSDQDSQTPDRKPRARIGPQRYLMLSALRALEVLSPMEMETLTSLGAKRIKDQIRADLIAGIIEETTAEDGTSKFKLTADGLDLLDRFERYKTQKGEPLPAATDALSDAAKRGVEKERNEGDGLSISPPAA